MSSTSRASEAFYFFTFLTTDPGEWDAEQSIDGVPPGPVWLTDRRPYSMHFQTSSDTHCHPWTRGSLRDEVDEFSSVPKSSRRRIQDCRRDIPQVEGILNLFWAFANEKTSSPGSHCGRSNFTPCHDRDSCFLQQEDGQAAPVTPSFLVLQACVSQVRAPWEHPDPLVNKANEVYKKEVPHRARLGTAGTSAPRPSCVKLTDKLHLTARKGNASSASSVSL